MSNQLKYTTIVFDLGAVLVDWNPKYFYRKVFHSEEAMDYFLNNITTFSWNEEQDGGRTISEANDLLTNQYPHFRTEIEAYYGHWVEMLGGSIQASVEVLRQLIDDSRYQVFALTNWSAETWPKALEIFDFLHWFDGVIVSGQEKMRKPHHEIFELMIHRFQLDVSKTIFIDDNLKNVLASRELGITTIHFQNPYQMKEELSQHLGHGFETIKL
jgi:2-haloacid dehalogenase